MHRYCSPCSDQTCPMEYFAESAVDAITQPEDLETVLSKLVIPLKMLILQNMQIHQTQIDAQFNAVHLLAAMVKLKPDWLPEELFDILYQRWNSPARLARSVASCKLQAVSLPLLYLQAIFHPSHVSRTIVCTRLRTCRQSHILFIINMSSFPLLV